MAISTENKSVKNIQPIIHQIASEKQKTPQTNFYIYFFQKFEKLKIYTNHNFATLWTNFFKRIMENILKLH